MHGAFGPVDLRQGVLVLPGCEWRCRRPEPAASAALSAAVAGSSHASNVSHLPFAWCPRVLSFSTRHMQAVEHSHPLGTVPFSHPRHVSVSLSLFELLLRWLPMCVRLPVRPLPRFSSLGTCDPQQLHPDTSDGVGTTLPADLPASRLFLGLAWLLLSFFSHSACTSLVLIEMVARP